MGRWGRQSVAEAEVMGRWGVEAGALGGELELCGNDNEAFGGGNGALELR